MFLGLSFGNRTNEQYLYEWTFKIYGVQSMDVQIREWKTEDAATLANLLNNKKIHDNLRDGLPFPYTVADATVFISAMLSADRDKTYAWAVTVNNIAVGSVSVFRKDNVHRLTAEMGYYISEAYWGKGVMTTAVKKACRYIFDNTDMIRIFAEPYDFNAASCRVLEKAGFVCEGILRKNAIKNGQVVDMKMYAITKE
ncbi:N-acetyltransferase [Clostridia bacterium]|nr:N-acetyltransferase [Clostridia bacterium]